MLTVRIVGSSAWSGGHRFSLRSSSGSGSSSVGGGDGGGSTTTNNNKFKIVTYSGLNMTCQCYNGMDVEVWLAALHSGLEASFTTIVGTSSSSSSSSSNDNSSKNGSDGNSSHANSNNGSIRPQENVVLDDDHTLPPPSVPSASSSVQYCRSCGKLGSNSDVKIIPSAIPLYQYPKCEARVDVCRGCLITQGVLLNVRERVGMYRAYAHERAALELATELVKNCLTNLKKQDEKKESTTTAVEGSGSEVDSKGLDSSWEDLASADTGPQVSAEVRSLSHLLQTPGFLTLRRRSRKLEIESRRWLNGTMHSSDEFLSLISPEHELQSAIGGNHLLNALKLANDFSSILNMLSTYCWNPEREGAIEMVTSTLDFLLTGVKQSVLRFYLPQLFQIHLKMLPARSATALIILDLYEDFLIHLATNGKEVHISLSLIWHLLASLDDGKEEGSGGNDSSQSISQKDSAMIFMLCKIESTIFCFQEGWGGGSVALGNLYPMKGSDHQQGLLLLSVQALRSIRDSLPFKLKIDDAERETLTEETKTKIANSYRKQIIFMRQLSNLAEELFSVPHDQQAKYLADHLGQLCLGISLATNSDNSISEVVRLPPSEGHVFRSKARTPVLLLLETTRWIDDCLKENSSPEVISPSETYDDTLDEVSSEDSASEEVKNSKTDTDQQAAVEDLVNSCLLNDSGRSGLSNDQLPLHEQHQGDDDEDNLGEMYNLKGILNLNVPSQNTLHSLGEGRREVLTSLLDSARYDSLAQSTTRSTYKFIQRLDQQRASQLLGNNDVCEDLQFSNGDSHQLQIELADPEEDEVMEALRILLLTGIHNHGITQHVQESNDENVGRHIANESDDDDVHTMKDAGTFDPRLAGCGPLGHAIRNALILFKKGTISSSELLELAKSDLKYNVHDKINRNIQLKEDSAFWMRFAFGERWAEKKSRIAATSPFGHLPNWDLQSIIVKANDDLRQEAFMMQLIQLCQEVWSDAGLELWLQPYTIVSTGKSTGAIETVKNALSLDALKKRDGKSSVRLLEHFVRMCKYATDPAAALNTCRSNFVRSLAAYSLICYLFQVKDRHNGNILIDTAGHCIHIDFGFIFGIAPGGAFSLESGIPFKLTEEMVEVMGGIGSPMFSEFVVLFCCGFMSLQKHAETFLTLIEITFKSVGSSMPCFEHMEDCKSVIDTTRQLFRTDLCSDGNSNIKNGQLSTVRHALDLIRTSMASYGTSQYDYFQYMSQGIAA